MKDITIQEWMRTQLNLKGNELITYAIIYQQSKESSFSIKYIAEWLGITKVATFKILKKLLDKGVILKNKETVDGTVSTNYCVKSDIIPNKETLN